MLLISLLLHCAAGDLPEVDQTDPRSSYPFQEHPCQTDYVDVDFWNCGDCGVRCSTENADSCVDGECRCGSDSVCIEGSDCRGSRCVDRDPAGPGCEFDDECAAGFVCIEGSCTRFECVPEACDLVDNDCDGIVDGTEAGPLSQWCWNGLYGDDIGEVLLPCVRGVRDCLGGVWSECRGDVLPVSEAGLLGCDDIDNDCDGCIDGVRSGDICISSEPDGFDVMFVFDVSGSMASYIRACTDASSEFSRLFSDNPNYRFGITTIAQREPEARIDRPYLYLDLTDFATFMAEISVLEMSGLGEEPQYDAIYELGTNELGVSWRESAIRILILFSDEQGQSTRDNFGLSDVGEGEMCDALTHGEVFAVVERLMWFADFDDCASYLFELDPDYHVMVEDLEDVISDPCR